jgi:hypothetical protein
MKRLTFIVVLTFLILVNVCYAQQKGMKRPSDQLDMPEVVYRKGWALLIGIDKYPDLPSQYQLNYSVADAEAMADLLLNKFGFAKENISILRDEQATKDKIKEKLNSFADPNIVDKQDCVLVYFSGHGQTVPLPRSGGEMGFLIPYDAKITNLSQEPNPAEYMQYCISMNELNEATKAIPAKHVIFIVDACYSGLVLGSYRGLNTNIPKFLTTVANAETRQMITAGTKGELSEERPDLGHGVFTYKLLKGLDEELADTNKDGVITGFELANYLTTAVQEITNGKQNPRFGRYEEGEFLFIPQNREPVVKIGKLAIQTDPPDAVVTINSVGLNPEKTYSASVGEVDLPPGTYNIAAEKDGYEKAIKDQIKVSTGASTTVRLALKQKPPTLATIDGQLLPQGTNIYIDGSQVTLPYKTSPGRYKLRFERSGYNTVESSETLTAGQSFSPNPKWVILPPATGIFQVQVTPMDAKLSVISPDTGKVFNVSSFGEIGLAPGRYTVTAKRKGYLDETKQFEIITNKRTPVTLTMRYNQPSYIKTQKGIHPLIAFGTSAVVPGLGQHLQGHKTRGYMYEGLVLGTGVYALIATSQHHNTLDDYNVVRDKLSMMAQSQTNMTSEIKGLLQNQEDAYNKANSAKSRAILAQVLFGVSWGINALDAGFLVKPDQNSSGLTLEIKPISDGSMIIARGTF